MNKAKAMKSQQKYLAEKLDWLERHVNRTSANMVKKVEEISLNRGQLLNQVIVESIFTPITYSVILMRENYLLTNQTN